MYGGMPIAKDWEMGEEVAKYALEGMKLNIARYSARMEVSLPAASTAAPAISTP